jgi:hypothetical protein
MESINSVLSEATNTDVALGFAALIVLGGAVKWALQSNTPKGTKEIPGPPGLPILKNILDVPQADEWIVFNKWQKQYGAFSRPPSAIKCQLN